MSSTLKLVLWDLGKLWQLMQGMGMDCVTQAYLGPLSRHHFNSSLGLKSRCFIKSLDLQSRHHFINMSLDLRRRRHCHRQQQSLTKARFQTNRKRGWKETERRHWRGDGPEHNRHQFSNCLTSESRQQYDLLKSVRESFILKYGPQNSLSCICFVP